MENSLSLEIDRLARSSTGYVGAYIAGRNHFLGKWLRYSTFFPSYQLRLLKRDRVRFRKEGHGQREITEGECVYLKESWRHEGFSKGLHQWISRHNNYSSDEVSLLLRLKTERLSLRKLLIGTPVERRRALKVLGAKLPFRPLTRFLYTYILRFGFLDGKAGLLFCLLRVAHDIHLVAKLEEAKVNK